MIMREKENLTKLGSGRTEYIRTFEPYHVPAEYFDFNFWRALI